MKKIARILFACISLCAGMLIIPSMEEAKAEVKTEYMQDVALDELHFPDEHVRQQLSAYVDLDKDGKLSREERGKVYYLKVGSLGCPISKAWYQDMSYQNNEDYIKYDKDKCALGLGYSWEGQYTKDEILNLSGIEYFFNLSEVYIDEYKMVTGSFKNNTKLRKLWVGSSKLETKSFDTIKEDFSVS